MLPNVKLLAIDQTITRESSGKEKDAAKAVAGQVGKTATVAVTPEQAEKLILEGPMGKLPLILRSVADSADDRARDYTTDVETSTALSKLVGRKKAGKARSSDDADAKSRSAKSAKTKDNGGGASTPLIINRGGERLAR